jgi:hypothetical protein
MKIIFAFFFWSSFIIINNSLIFSNSFIKTKFINNNPLYLIHPSDLITNNNNNNDLINYLISFKDYTIISEGYKNKYLESLLIENNMNVYYVNIDNLLNKDDVLDFMKKKYRNCNSGDNLWFFYKGFFMGSYDELLEIIDKKIQKNLR